MHRTVRSLVASTCLLGAACASAPPPMPQPTYEEKLAAILRLEDSRSLRDPAPLPVVMPPGRRRGVVLPAAPPPPDLVRWLGDADAAVRRRAALAVGRVGLTEGVSPLAALLGDPDAAVRQMAAFGLGLLGDRSAVAPLTAALEDRESGVQGRAAEALGLIGDQAAAGAIGRMVARHVGAGALSALPPDETRQPLDPPVEAARLGVYALARLRVWDPLAAAVLSPGGEPLSRWWPIAYALQRVRDRRAIPALLLLVRAESAETRLFAAAGLGALKEPSAVDHLVPLADGWRDDPRLAAVAVRALGQIGERRAAPALIRLLQARDLDPAVRLEGLSAIGSCRAGEAVDLLLDFLSHPSPVIRAAALGSLRQVDAEAFTIALSGLDPDPHWSVRAAVGTLVGSLDAAIAVPRLMQALGDADPRVKPAVLAALVAAKAPRAVDVVVEHLTHEDAIVRAAAASAVGELRPEGGADRLAAAYRRGLGDETYVARGAALAALARYGAAAAVPVMTEALADRDWAVRRRAAGLLVELGAGAAAAAAIRPAPGARPAEAYGAASLVAPTVSPHAFIETERGSIEIELDVRDAPLTSDNFARLAAAGFFNGLALHRVVAGFVVQGGDPRGDGEGGPGYTIRDELNPTPYVRGTVGMALDWADTGGSQFFVTTGPQPHLDGRYTAFGRVVAGMEVIDRLQAWDVIRRVWIWDGVKVTGH